MNDSLLRELLAPEPDQDTPTPFWALTGAALDRELDPLLMLLVREARGPITVELTARLFGLSEPEALERLDALRKRGWVSYLALAGHSDGTYHVNYEGLLRSRPLRQTKTPESTTTTEKATTQR